MNRSITFNKTQSSLYGHHSTCRHSFSSLPSISPPRSFILGPSPSPFFPSILLKQSSNSPNTIITAAKPKNKSSSKTSDNDNNTSNSKNSNSLVGSVGLWGLWLGLIAYTALLSPNQTPVRDMYFLTKLIMDNGDGVAINTVFTQLFFIMGVWPLVYSALLIPAGKSGNGVKAWPFLTASYGVGAFGLLPFMALWQPPSPAPQLPPQKDDLQGPGNLLGQAMESPIVAYGLLAGALLCIGKAALAGSDSWVEYGRLVQESRFVHTTTLDFLTLTTLAPFWMLNDAQLRGWEKKGLLPLLCALPVVGPCVYLVLRPKAQ